MDSPLLKDRYELTSTLARGTLTTTHDARDRRNGERCVVKILSLRRADALKGHELLLREAETLRRLEHPRIPRLLDFFSEEADGELRVCLVQQHVDGRSLADLVAGGRRFAEAETAAIGAKVAGILEYLHGLAPPVLHRDVKPANVLLTGAGRVYLVDFGAAVRDHVRTRPLFHPGGATVVGTRGYMPIEQFEGRAVPASDLYALGATLAHVLSGKAPADMEKDGLALDFEPHLAASPGLLRLLERLLRPDWRERPGSAREVREEFERLSEAARRPPPRPRPARPPRTAFVAALAAAAVLGAAVLLATLAGRERAPSIATLAREIELARGPAAEASGIAVDEIVLRAGAVPDDEMARWAGQDVARDLTTSPPAWGRVVPGLPAEARPVPREGLPAGRDVSALVRVDERPGLVAYVFTGEISGAEALDLDLDAGVVWVGTAMGLLRHDPRAGGWRLWDETSGLPGRRLYRVAAVGDTVIVDSSEPTGPGRARSIGVLAFDRRDPGWRLLEPRPVWDLEADGNTIWIGMRDGAAARDLETGEVRRFAAGAGQLLHRSVHAVRRHDATVWFAMLGDWAEAKRGFEGGGVTVFDEASGTFRSYTERDGLAHAYSSDLFVDETEAFVAHWARERGLSRFDRRTGRWQAVERSRNGVELGGPVLAGDRASVFVGQQGALVRYDRRTGEAMVWREADGVPGFSVTAVAVGERDVWAAASARDQDRVRVTGVMRIPHRP